MKKLIIFLLLLASIANAQIVDTESKAILDRLSAKMNSLKTMRIKYTYTHENLQNKSKSSDDGLILIKDNKYKVSMLGTEIYSDGLAIWTYLKEQKELTIVPSGGNKNSLDFTNPRNLLSFYNKDFKYNYVGEENVAGKSYFKIDLYPKNLKSSYSRIRLVIDKSQDQLTLMKVFLSDGNHFTFEIKEFTSNLLINDQELIFDTVKNKDVEIIDMR